MNMQKLALALSLSLAATACGGSSSPTEAASDETTTTEAAVTTTVSPVDVDRYCELAVLANDRSDSYGDGQDFSPEGFESFLTEINGYLAEASVVVDPSISKPFAVTKEKFDEITTIAVAADYDIFAIIDEMDALDSLSRYESAGEAVEAYDEEFCGIAPDDEAEVEVVEETVEDAAAIGAVSLEDAELVIEIMKTQEGLDIVVDGFLAEAPNVSREQASCFLSSMTAEQFVSFAAMAEVDQIDPSNPSVAETFVLMESCDISLADLLP